MKCMTDLVTFIGIHLNFVMLVLVGINYVGDSPGELSGCWNDVLNMKKYIMDVHGFEEDNIVVLMDDGNHTEPTAGKSALVLFYLMYSCVQYKVSTG